MATRSAPRGRERRWVGLERGGLGVLLQVRDPVTDDLPEGHVAVGHRPERDPELGPDARRLDPGVGLGGEAPAEAAAAEPGGGVADREPPVVDLLHVRPHRGREPPLGAFADHQRRRREVGVLPHHVEDLLALHLRNRPTSWGPQVVSSSTARGQVAAQVLVSLSLFMGPTVRCGAGGAIAPGSAAGPPSPDTAPVPTVCPPPAGGPATTGPSVPDPARTRSTR